MFSKETDTLLHKCLHDMKAPLPRLVCEPSLRHDMDDLVAMVLPRMTLGIVDDRHTSYALGSDVFQALQGRFACVRIGLDGDPVADLETVNHLRQKASACDALIAVGSGTVSDLCKYASFLDGKPYLVFPTAASMNGYLSANASITVDGYKTTFAAHMPRAVFCDLSVIARAPSRLNKSGLGDSLARPTAQADWLISHLLLGTVYNEAPFTLLASVEPALWEHARGIALADRESLALLMQILLLSGLGMTIAGGSYPASQAEHMVAHTYEMMMHHQTRFHPQAHPVVAPTLHGEEIGVTTLTTARLQERLLRGSVTLQPVLFPEDAIEGTFGSRVAKEARKFYTKKREIIEQSGLGVSNITRRWESAISRIESVIIPSAKIEAILTAAQAPIIPESLGWQPADYAASVGLARFLRDRFTCLDLLDVP